MSSKPGRKANTRLTAAATLVALLSMLLTATTATAALPVVETGSAKEIKRTSMTLCGTVNPESEATTFHFIYEHYEEGWQAETTTPASAGSGNAAEEECTNITGLKTGTRYGYQIVAENASGENAGAGQYVATSSAVEELESEPASNLKRLGVTSEVTLNGALAPNGYDTHYYFEYRKEHLGSVGENETSPVAPGADAGDASKLEHVSTTVQLQTNVAYEFRLVGVNQLGATYGNGVSVMAPAVEGVKTGAPTGITASGAALHGTIEPNGYDTHWQFKCFVSGLGGINPRYPIPSEAGDAGSVNGPVSVQAALTRLSNGNPLEGNTPMSCQLVATDSLGSDEGGEVQFTTPKAAPVIETGETSLTPTSAGVHADIETENEATKFWVQYVPAVGYEPAAANPYAVGGTTAAAELEATPYVFADAARGISGLAAGTTYHYRFLAENATGTTDGPDETFTTPAATPPVISTGSATGVSATGATISGAVNPEGLKTSYEFQIGESSSYGGAQIFGNAGEAGGDEPVSATLQYLVPGTTYHYRVVATNTEGTTYGPDETFTTPEIASPIGQPPPTPLLNVALGAQFPSEPSGRGATAGKPQARQLTRKQKLSRALKQCAQKKNKAKRKSCEAAAKKKFGGKIKAKRKTSRG
jgi:hypothetical protein